MTTSTPDLTEELKIDVLDHLRIPIENIVRNPINPRPAYSLVKDDPDLLSLADAIKTKGQHRAAMVYEQVGHYSLPDQPGTYVLLQGERRWTACGIGNVPTLRADVVATPQSRLQELHLLGCEESFKVEWGKFGTWMWAKDMAESMGVPITHPEVRAYTGLNESTLRRAQKIFSLEPEIYQLVYEYEKIKYETGAERRVKGAGRRRLSAAGEFGTEKAELVYDIFKIIRESDSYNMVASQFSDAELQMRLASTRDSNAKLENFKKGLALDPARPAPGLLTDLAKMLEEPQRFSTAEMVASTQASEMAKLKKFETGLDKISRSAHSLARVASRLGNDVATLRQVQLTLLQAIRNVEKLEQGISKRVKELEQKEASAS